MRYITKTLRFLSIAQTALKSSSLDQKVVVFESDDWGSIRTPTGIGDHFAKFGINLSKSPYHQFDTLESGEDFEALLETLAAVERETGKNPKITLNYVMGNPDFQKIEQSSYQHYHFKAFTKTYERHWGQSTTAQMLNQVKTSPYFLPQFHGREHIQVPFWLEQLRNKDKVFLRAFELGFSGADNSLYSKPERNVQATFDVRNMSELAFSQQALAEGLSLFKATFGFASQSFIPNNYIWPAELNPTLIEQGVKYLQGMKLHAHPRPPEEAKRKYSPRGSGKRTPEGLINLVRNSAFEPAFYKDKEAEFQKCLNEIAIAFLFKQPAVISTHRINFVGGLSERNRTENLKLFKRLLTTIAQKWPDVVFWDSVQLGEHLEKRTL